MLTWPPSSDEIQDAEHEGDERIARCLNRDLLVWPASKQWLMWPRACAPVARHGEAVDAEWPRPWLKAGRYREYA
jgi:hypothetical protein